MERFLVRFGETFAEVVGDMEEKRASKPSERAFTVIANETYSECANLGSGLPQRTR